jgi:hypothetical protein
MTLSETLKLLRKNEKEIGLLLENALLLKRHRKQSNVNIMRSADAHYLPAVNSRARVKLPYLLRRYFAFSTLLTINMAHIIQLF